MKRYISIYLVLALVAAMSLQSCNKKNDEPASTTTDYDVYSSASTLVSSFGLKANTKILAHLDSVKFTIDQDRGIIYNVDSLPRGTRINALLVDLSTAANVSSREFIIKNGTVQRDTTISYNSSKSDSIDFTGDVTLRITSYDKAHVRDYKVKVNVHKQDVDAMVWDPGRRRDLPNVMSTLWASKTVMQDGNFLCLVNDNGSYVLSRSDDPLAGTWEKAVLPLPFTPQIESFNATSDALYLLDGNGQLFMSDDMGQNWSDCGVAWHSIIGVYGNKLMGVMKDADGNYLHAEYAQGAAIVGSQIPNGFPVESMSNMVMASNEWTSSQQAMIVGGIIADGSFSNKVWGYDGKTWAPLSSGNVLPEVSDAVIFPYYTMVKSTTGTTYVKKVTWMIMGGRLSDGNINTKSYVSRNQCINWSVGESTIQQPDYMPAFYGAQVYSYDRTRTSSSTLRAYSPGHVTPVTEWECPYIYIFGGYGNNGTPLNSIWEGVLTGLTFKPVF